MRITRGAEIFLQGHLGDTPVDWLVDTGCTTTILSHAKYQELSPDIRPALQYYPAALLTADDSPLRVYGAVPLKLNLAGAVVRHQVVIADIMNDGLIGIDVLRKCRCKIDFKTKEVMWETPERKVRCVERHRPPSEEKRSPQIEHGESESKATQLQVGRVHLVKGWGNPVIGTRPKVSLLPSSVNVCRTWSPMPVVRRDGPASPGGTSQEL